MGAMTFFRVKWFPHSHVKPLPGMGVGRTFSKGPKAFFQGGNSGEIPVYQLETNRKTFFY